MNEDVRIPTTTERNWAGNLEYQAARFLRPSSVAEAQEMVRRSSNMRPLGSRHSFNGIADTTGDLLSLEKLDAIVGIDREQKTVTIEGGVRYGDLGAQLHRAGFALHNLASLPHISVAGACATATHGSGERNGNLATAVHSLDVITADGEITSFSRDHDETFYGSVVSLGALGVVARITLDMVPTFDIAQEVYETLSFDRLETAFDAIQDSAYSVSLFTDWTSNDINQVWLKRRVEDSSASASDSFHGAVRANTDRHPIPGASAIHCTPQAGVTGPWHERLPHFRADFTPSSGDELQSEYFVPRANALAATRAIQGIRTEIAPLLLISEIRSIGRDEFWLSPCYRKDNIAFHFTWKQDWNRVKPLLSHIESVLAPFAALPHWGKLFTTSPEELRNGFPRLPDFQRLAERCDPTGKFRNEFLTNYVLG